MSDRQPLDSNQETLSSASDARGEEIRKSICAINAAYVFTDVRNVQLRRDLLTARELLESLLENAPQEKETVACFDEDELIKASKAIIAPGFDEGPGITRFEAASHISASFRDGAKWAVGKMKRHLAVNNTTEEKSHE